MNLERVAVGDDFDVKGGDEKFCHIVVECQLAVLAFTKHESGYSVVEAKDSE